MSKKSSDSTGDKVKKQESKYDANVLRDLIRNGKTASEIMLAMSIGHKQILVLPGFPWVTPVRNWPGRGLDRHRRSRWLS